MGVSCVRAQEMKDALVEWSVLVVKDFGDGAVPTNYMFQQMAPRVIAEVVWDSLQHLLCLESQKIRIDI